MTYGGGIWWTKKEILKVRVTKEIKILVIDPCSLPAQLPCGYIGDCARVSYRYPSTRACVERVHQARAPEKGRNRYVFQVGVG